ncbi:MAG TPA: DUF4405 domain-containing protein [Syntrophales bacterium]|nr:DUF4405 domain-containing protein [Syntrophales bacterium]
MQSNKGKFLNTRAFTALGAAISGLGLPLTGYANHLYQFSAMTTPRHAWMAAHNILAVLFLAFAAWHVILNRKALLRHVKGIVRNIPFPSREAVLAGLVVASVVFLFVGHAFVAGG